MCRSVPRPPVTSRDIEGGRIHTRIWRVFEAAADGHTRRVADLEVEIEAGDADAVGTRGRSDRGGRLSQVARSAGSLLRATERGTWFAIRSLGTVTGIHGTAGAPLAYRDWNALRGCVFGARESGGADTTAQSRFLRVHVTGAGVEAGVAWCGNFFVHGSLAKLGNAPSAYHIDIAGLNVADHWNRCSSLEAPFLSTFKHGVQVIALWRG